MAYELHDPAHGVHVREEPQVGVDPRQRSRVVRCEVRRVQVHGSREWCVGELADCVSALACLRLARPTAAKGSS